MELDNLWLDLQPEESRLNVIKLDLADGKVPELPFFIIDEEEVKTNIKKQLERLDGLRLQCSVISADYGNGKTNLLKYLQMYFKGRTNVSFLYIVADDEQNSIYMQLLQVIQRRLISVLIESINNVQKEPEKWAQFISNVNDTYSDISEYTDALIKETDETKIRNLIYLGTGRLYSKTSFSKAKLVPFDDFDRRLVLGWFLNILSFCHHYVVFAIDELEKIQSRSKIRMNKYLTTFRELLDISSDIKGHIVLTCITNANDLYAINPAFYTRIKINCNQLKPLNNKGHIQELITKLNKLFKSNKNEEDLNAISSQLWKAKVPNNRALMQKAAEYLNMPTENTSINEILAYQEYVDLKKEFDEHKKEMEEGVFKATRRSNILFDPLEYYLLSFNALAGGPKLDKRDLKMYYDKSSGVATLFLFENNDISNLKEKVAKIDDLYSPNAFIIYAPDESDISKSLLLDVGIDNDRAEIEYYNIDDFIVLLDLYREKLNLQPLIAKVVHRFTKNIL